MQIVPRFVPVLDPGFVPAVLWTRAFRETVAVHPEARSFRLAMTRPTGFVAVHEGALLPARENALNVKYVERLLKFLLWQKGGNRILIEGAPDIAAILAGRYAPGGERAFDHGFFGEQTYDAPFSIEAVDAVPDPNEGAIALGRHLEGCRIGFDLGGSDRKAAAVIDGKVVFSEEIPWDPYFESDPQYHLDGIRDSLKRAAAHLPRVDAIGGSAAGVYVDNEVRVASLFRGIGPEDFEEHVKGIFKTLRDEWGGVPFDVVNDGEVTALAGSMSLEDNCVLGVSMGTSEAAGYVDAEGHIKPWLNELAFTPVDYREGGPVDEWSGDEGCGVQFFSQQGVARLAPAAGFEISDLPFAEQLVKVQEAMAAGDERAAKIYETIGTCFGYGVAHYADFYAIENLLILGRVTSGRGGELILEKAKEVLDGEFPELGRSIHMSTPDEQMKRHGQAVAAASLPAIG
jgi:predicted NBD/HSP70 family sugar kinase